MNLVFELWKDDLAIYKAEGNPCKISAIIARQLIEGEIGPMVCNLLMEIGE